MSLSIFCCHSLLCVCLPHWTASIVGAELDLCIRLYDLGQVTSVLWASFIYYNCFSVVQGLSWEVTEVTRWVTQGLQSQVAFVGSLEYKQTNKENTSKHDI